MDQEHTEEQEGDPLRKKVKKAKRKSSIMTMPAGLCSPAI